MTVVEARLNQVRDASSAEKMEPAPLSARQEIARLRIALDEIEDLANPHSEIRSIARKALDL